MRRVVIAIVLLALIGASCWVSYVQIEGMYEQIAFDIQHVRAAIAEENVEKLKNSVEDMCATWKNEEMTVIHYVRHKQIDEITKSVARLSALMMYGQLGDLEGEISSIEWQIDHIRDAEQLYFRNIW